MTYRFGDFEFDLRRYELRRAGKLIRLQPKPLAALYYLLRHRDRIVMKEELVMTLWSDVAVGDGSLGYCIHMVRKALGQKRRAESPIRTVHGIGFQFVGEVVEESPPSERLLNRASASGLGVSQSLGVRGAGPGLPGSPFEGPLS